jgi:hypothetical protein
MDGTRYPAPKEFTWSDIEVLRYLALPYRIVPVACADGRQLAHRSYDRHRNGRPGSAWSQNLGT